MNSKTSLIIGLIANLIYIILGVVLLILNHVNTVSIVLLSLIILVSIVSAVLIWRNMYALNHPEK